MKATAVHIKRSDKSDLYELLTSRRIVVCLGSGGVGKTTLATSLGLWGVLNAQRTAILTIDPAHRLAQCLGLAAQTAHQVSLSPEDFLSHGLKSEETLEVFHVDQKNAWDALVEHYVATHEARTRLRANAFFQGLSQYFSGAYDYVALELLATLIETNDYDLIVVDTPPARHALDFLRTPAHLQNLLDHSVSKWFLQSALPGGLNLFSLASHAGIRLLEKIEHATGLSTLGDIAEFFALSAQVLQTLSTRFMQASRVLMSEETALLLITTLQAASHKQLNVLCRGLDENGLSLNGIIVNRVLSGEGNAGDISAAQRGVAHSTKIIRGARLKKSQRQWLVDNYVGYQRVLEAEIQEMRALQSKFPSGISLRSLPLLPAGPVDLGSLVELHPYIFSPTLHSGVG